MDADESPNETDTDESPNERMDTDESPNDCRNERYDFSSPLSSI